MKRIDSVSRIGERDRRLLAELKQVVMRHIPDAQLALYGSTARGTAGPESDYDVLVLTRNKLSGVEEREVDRAVYSVQLENEIVLSVIIYTYDEWRNPVFRSSPYRKNVMREGIIL